MLLNTTVGERGASEELGMGRNSEALFAPKCALSPRPHAPARSGQAELGAAHFARVWGV